MRPHRGVGAILLALCCVAATTVSGDDLTLPDNPLKGRLLFESRGCESCHGLSRSSTGPDLIEGHFSGSFLELGAALWNHVPGMSVEHELSGLPWPELDSKEVVELVAFLH